MNRQLKTILLLLTFALCANERVDVVKRLFRRNQRARSGQRAEERSFHGKIVYQKKWHPYWAAKRGGDRYSQPGAYAYRLAWGMPVRAIHSCPPFQGNGT